ncbi:MAG: hypothetical protein ACRCZF_16530 [Gemmataceae bacterium]
MRRTLIASWLMVLPLGAWAGEVDLPAPTPAVGLPLPVVQEAPPVSVKPMPMPNLSQDKVTTPQPAQSATVVTMPPALPCATPTVVAPMSVTPTVGPLAMDCNQRVIGCPTGTTCGPRMNPFGRMTNWLCGPSECSVSSCGPTRPRISINININLGNRGCATTAGCSKSCWEKFRNWMTWKPCDGPRLASFRPMPYQTPLLYYFPADKCSRGGNGCQTGCGAASCQTGCGPRCAAPIGGRLFNGGMLDWFRPSGFGYGHANIHQEGCSKCGNGGDDCACAKFTTRYASPCHTPVSPAISTNPARGNTPGIMPGTAPATGTIIPTGAKLPAPGVLVNQPYSKP